MWIVTCVLIVIALLVGVGIGYYLPETWRPGKKDFGV